MSDSEPYSEETLKVLIRSMDALLNHQIANCSSNDYATIAVRLRQQWVDFFHDHAEFSRYSIMALAYYDERILSIMEFDERQRAEYQTSIQIAVSRVECNLVAGRRI